MKITFWKKNSGLIMGRIRVGDGGKFDHSTEIKISPKVTLKNNKATGDRSESTDVNKRLKAFELMIYDKLETAETYGYHTSTEQFKKFLKSKSEVAAGDEFLFINIMKEYQRMLNDGEITKEDGSKLSKYTIKGRTSILNTFMQMPDEVKNFDFRKYNSFAKREIGNITVDREYRKLFQNIVEFLETDMDYSPNTIRKNIIDYKIYLNYYLGMHGIEVGDLLKRVFKASSNFKGDVLTIAPEKALYLISNYRQISEICTPTQKVGLQYWVTALTLLPRMGDMLNWTKDNIYEDEQGKMMIRYTQRKTGAEVHAPVPDSIVPIFRRNLMELGRPLPPTERTGISPLLKRIASKLEIFQNEVTVIRKKGGKVITEKKQEWELIKIHAMRATGITNLISWNVADPIIKSLSGHTENSQSYAAYQNITPQISAQAVNVYEQAISNHQQKAG